MQTAAALCVYPLATTLAGRLNRHGFILPLMYDNQTWCLSRDDATVKIHFIAKAIPLTVLTLICRPPLLDVMQNITRRHK